jgi:hypothetical protein
VTVAAAAPATKTTWRIVGEVVVSCNCAWGCPCQFNALPTHHFCEAIATSEIEHGHFGDTSLDDVKYAQIFHWDGAVHEGNGWRQLILDAGSTQEQRAAIVALTSGTQGHPAFEIFAAMTPNVLEPIVAPIELEHDREKRQARVWIAGIAECQVEPIRNPVTGEEHRARIDLPNGFEFKLAEVGNSVHWRTTAGPHLSMEHENTFASLAHFDWSSDGTSR